MENFDVIVIGGGTSGCACAWNCAKLGLSVLLIEKSMQLGGAITSGLVVPVMNSGKNQINTDFYKFLISEMKKNGGQITYQDNPGWFNPVILKIVLDKILTEAGVKILFNSAICNYKKKLNLISHVQTCPDNLSPYNELIYNDNIGSNESNILSEYIGTKYIVDATGNGNFCQKINCKILENDENFQPMSLRFIMSGIDLDAFGKFLINTDSDREVTTVEKIDGQTHLSTAYTWDSDKHWALVPFFDDAVSKNILKNEDRNYFQVFSIAGMPDSVAFNCPRISQNFNPNNPNDISKALIEGRSAIYRLSEFCKKYFPGFEKAYISDIADSIGIRVSNRIQGKYIYTKDDLVSGKTFDNPAVVSNYPIDVHSAEKDKSKLHKTGEYQLPIESLMSDDYENVYMVGRCLSADFEAQAALRVQASCFSMGEAVAKHIKKRISS